MSFRPPGHLATGAERISVMRHALVLALLCLGLSFSATTHADQSRRPGLGGSYTSRHLTTPYNSLTTILGPGQTPLFGQRYRGYVRDGGVSYAHNTPISHDGAVGQNQAWTSLGVAFGLGAHVEAGALFLNLRYTPDFALADFPVFITYGWTFGPLDVGARFSFLTPAESGTWSLNPGVPLLLRLGHTRIDSGFILNATLDQPTTLGFNLPLRVTHNITPHIFLGAETGLFDGAFTVKGDTAFSLGALLGYTMLLGKRVVDVSASMTWDNFLLPNAPSGSGTFQLDTYRCHLGITMHQLVM